MHIVITNLKQKKTIRMLEMDDASAVNYPNEKVLVYLKKSLVF